MKKTMPIFLIVLLGLFFVPARVFAVSVGIINAPASITDDAFTLTASISGAATGTNYLKVDIYKEGTSNYFGETFNGSDWYSGSDGKQYFPITVKTGSIWNGSIQARSGSFSSNDYDGSGTYKIRLRRYTSSGGSGSEDANLSAISIHIAVPTVTPTPTDVPPPTTTPIPSKTPTPTPTKSPTAKPTQKNVTSTIEPKITDASVLGDSTKSAEEKVEKTPTPKDQKVMVKGASINVLSSSFILLGGGLIMGCGILLFLQRKNNV